MFLNVTFKNNLVGKYNPRNWFARVLNSSSEVLQQQRIRHFNLQENVNFKILKDYGISVPNFRVAKIKGEAIKFAEELKTENLVIKAQVLSGGRAKGTFKNGFVGGVQMAFSPKEAEIICEKMLGQYLVTKQSGPEGKLCNAVMIAERKFPRKEFYLTIMMERSFKGPVVIASSQGGVNIEDVAATNPKAIVYEPINYTQGLKKEQAKRVLDTIGIHGKHSDMGIETMMKMYKLFTEKDCVLVEINPFAEDSEGVFYALDCKINFDTNASFRHKDIFALKDVTQKDEKEVRALKYNLNYIVLDGSIGCMVNGAGLAMATLDIIALYGGSAANFLDVGGGATSDAVHAAFKIITSDKRVNTILVNIFGGIIRCDLIAEGIVSAAKTLNLNIPIICRLQGTNMDEAKIKIAASGMRILPVDNLDEAARLGVKLAKIMTLAHEAHMDVKFQPYQLPL